MRQRSFAYIGGMDEVFQRAVEVLGSAKKATSWMSAPNRALAGATPIAMVGTLEGVQAVLQVLGRIEHGLMT